MTVGELHHVEICQSGRTSRIEYFCRSEIKPICAACELNLHLYSERSESNLIKESLWQHATCADADLPCPHWI